jgi:hypothetical protein
MLTQSGPHGIGGRRSGSRAFRLIIDSVLPGSNGIDFARAAKTANPVSSDGLVRTIEKL